MSRKDTLMTLRGKYDQLAPHLNEKTRRLWAATEAQAAGYGGVSLAAKAVGMSRTTVHAGLAELEEQKGKALSDEERQRIRRPGGGRKKLVAKDPTLVRDLDALIEPVTRGDPESPLRWTCKSTTKLAQELRVQGHRISQPSVGALLHAMGYSLQANRKTREGVDHPDRDAQFQTINAAVRQFHAERQPVISVDTKKKELVGNFKNAGREWHPKGKPPEVNVHDFADEELGKVIPYGVYDLALNAGWVNLGIDHDTAAFAVASIERWWKQMGKQQYPHADKLLITADCGGSNGYRTRLWKVRLQRLADDIRIPISVRHFPPGTSKWNTIEHRMFSFISQNWRGKPLIDRATVINLIAHTQTQKGLRITAVLDKRKYQTGKKVPDAIMHALLLQEEPFHGEWNYNILPRRK